MTTARWYTPSGRSIQGAALDSAMGADARGADGVAYRSTAAGRSRRAAGWCPTWCSDPTRSPRRESLFAQALGEQIPVFRDVLTAYALELTEGPRRSGASSSR